jgi:hypothetical protein
MLNVKSVGRVQDQGVQYEGVGHWAWRVSSECQLAEPPFRLGNASNPCFADSHDLVFDHCTCCPQAPRQESSAEHGALPVKSLLGLIC